ncbi:MAG: sugar phosphate isomerase/epimerase family protein [Candidatus Brocadiia bacterium]
MFQNLAPGAVGVRGSTEETAPLAAQAGFQGLDLDLGEAAERVQEGQLDALRAVYERHGLRPGGFGLPVDFRGDEETFRQGVDRLARRAPAAAAMGCRRCFTWLAPASDELPFDQNFERHRSRLGACARVLGEHGCRLGLEFVGPKTSREGKQHEFIYDLPGMLELAEAIGTGNVGLLLDSWHWYTSGGTADQLRALRPDQVVYVHVNDAPRGVAVEEQVDNVRAMPGATGVIDMAAFLGALEAIGYDGPVTAEPFVPALRELEPAEALRRVAASLDAIFEAAGVTPRPPGA